MGKGRLLFERSEFSRPHSNSCCFAAVQHSDRPLRAPFLEDNTQAIILKPREAGRGNSNL